MTDIKLEKMTAEEAAEEIPRFFGQLALGPFEASPIEQASAFEAMLQHYKESHPEQIDSDGNPHFWCGGFGSSFMFNWIFGPGSFMTSVKIQCRYNKCDFIKDVTDYESM